MHRDEAIYARADAHAITLTAEEAGIALDVLRAHLGMQGGRLSDLSFPGKVQRLGARLETACGLPPYEDAPPDENWWDDRTHTEGVAE